MKRTVIYTYLTPIAAFLGLCYMVPWVFNLFYRPDDAMCVDECNPDPIAELVLSGMHETDGPVYEATEVKPPPSMQELLPTLSSKYGTGSRNFNDQAFIAFWDDTAKRFEQVYGVPAEVQLTVLRHETHGFTAGAGRRGAGFGIKAGKTTDGFNRFGIPDYMNLNGIDSKETWSPSVSYTGYTVTWLTFAHF